MGNAHPADGRSWAATGVVYVRGYTPSPTMPITPLYLYSPVPRLRRFFGIVIPRSFSSAASFSVIAQNRKSVSESVRPLVPHQRHRVFSTAERTRS